METTPNKTYYLKLLFDEFPISVHARKCRKRTDNIYMNCKYHNLETKERVTQPHSP